MAERETRRDGNSKATDAVVVDPEVAADPVRQGDANAHRPGQNVWAAVSGSLPIVEISDDDYRSLHLPCDQLEE